MSHRLVPKSDLRVIRPLRDFLHTEAAGSTLIVGAVLTALIWANSPWGDLYDRLWANTASVEVAGHVLALDLRHWVSDGAMTLFFLVVGLEVKRELTLGELRDRRKAAVPIVAAIGGMAVPGLLYLAIGSAQSSGWAVPTATDIALALGALSILSDRVPSTLRAFLLTLAIVDDIAAVLVIAVFYTEGLQLWPLVGALVVTAVAYAFRRRFSSGGLAATCVVLWLLLHESGVHATLAGVIAGLLAPLTPARQSDVVDADELRNVLSVAAASRTVSLARQSVSTLEWLEHSLHPWSTKLVVPLFALANAGISLDADTLRNAAQSSVSWAVFVGLVIGKPLGIVTATVVATRLLGSRLPAGADTRDILGVGALGGIGFTISLVIANRAFDDPNVAANATLSILVASIAAAALGLVLLQRPGRAVQAKPSVETTTNPAP